MEKTTVGQLRSALERYPDDFQVIFGCEELEFYRTKQRGANLVQIEFNQTVYAVGDKIIVETHNATPSQAGALSNRFRLKKKLTSPPKE